MLVCLCRLRPDSVWLFSSLWLHSGVVVGTVTWQQDVPGFKSRPGHFCVELACLKLTFVWPWALHCWADFMLVLWWSRCRWRAMKQQSAAEYEEKQIRVCWCYSDDNYFAEIQFKSFFIVNYWKKSYENSCRVLTISQKHIKMSIFKSLQTIQ